MLKATLIFGLCFLFCTACGAKTEYYFCSFYVPGVPANKTAAGFDEIIIIENTDLYRTLHFQWEFDGISSVDTGRDLISVYPSSELNNFHSFYVYNFKEPKKTLYGFSVLHYSVEEFKRVHRMSPTKANINKLNESPEMLLYAPKPDNPKWIAYAFLNSHYSCSSLSYPGGYIFRTLLRIIEALMIG